MGQKRYLFLGNIHTCDTTVVLLKTTVVYQAQMKIMLAKVMQFN